MHRELFKHPLRLNFRRRQLRRQQSLGWMCSLSVSSKQQQHGTKHRHIAYIRNFLSSGPLPYENGWAWQHVLLQRRLNYIRCMQQHPHLGKSDDKIDRMDCDADGNNDWVLLFEHQPVYTLGRGASIEHLTFLNESYNNNDHSDATLIDEYRRRLCRTYRGKDASRLTFGIDSKQCTTGTNSTFEDEVNYCLHLLHDNNSPPVHAPNNSPIYRIERGGEVTFHGPGQLVIYPMLHLQHPSYQQDLHWYIRQVEEVIIQTLEVFNISSHRDSINSGVWIGKEKIAAVGVSSSRWITSHGVALNVSPDLSYFGREVITPCGIEAEGRGVTSIATILQGREQQRRRRRRQLNTKNNNDSSRSSHTNATCLGVDTYCDCDDNDCPTVEQVAKVVMKCFEDVFDVKLIPWESRFDEGTKINL